MTFPWLRPRHTAGLLLALVLLTLGLRLHSLEQPTPPDMCVYATIGHQMLAGERLYADLVDNKPPAVYVTYMLAVALGGYRAHTIVWLGALFTVASLLFMFLILRRLAGPGIALLGGLAWALSSNCLHLFANAPNTETFINTFLLAAVYCLIRGEFTQPRFVAGSGLALAVASLYKTNVVFIQLTLGLFLLWLWWRDPSVKNPKRLLTRILAFSLPGALVWSGVFLFFYLRGTWDEFSDVVFKTLGNMAGNVFQNQWRALTLPGTHAAAFKHEIVVLSVLAALWAGLKTLTPKTRTEALLPAWCLGAWLMVSAVPSPPPYYYPIFLPPLVLLAALAFRELERVLPPTLRLRKTLILGLACLGLGFLGLYTVRYLLTPAENISRHASKDDVVAERTLAQMLGALTGPNETLYQWGMSPGLYFHSQRRPASGVIMTHILYLCPEDVRDKLKNKIFQSLSRSKPAFLLFTQWTGRLKEIMVYQRLQDEYRYFGLYDKTVIFVRKDLPLDPEVIRHYTPRIVDTVMPGLHSGRLTLAEETPESVVLEHLRQPTQRIMLAQQGETPDIRLLLAGNTYARQGQWDQAFEAWGQSRTLEREVNLGLYFEHIESYYRALSCYQIGYETFGHPWDEYYRQVQWKLIYQAQHQQVPSQLNQHRRDLFLPTGQDDYAHRIRAGNTEAGAGRWYKARDIWLDAVRAYPARPEAFANLGIFFEIHSTYDPALEAYARAAQQLGEPWKTYYQEVLAIKKNATNSH